MLQLSARQQAKDRRLHTEERRENESEEVALVRIDSGTMCTITLLPHLEKCYSFWKGVLWTTKARQETDANYHTCRVSRKRKQKQPRNKVAVWAVLDSSLSCYIHRWYTPRTKKLRWTMKRLLQKIINTSGDCFWCLISKNGREIWMKKLL